MRTIIGVALVGGALSQTARVDPTTTYGVWTGWGTSVCWWGNGYGARADLIQAIFTTKTTTISDAQVSVPGLGLNIARYNAGGSSWNIVNGSKMVVSPNIPHWKQIEGYWLDGASSDPSTPSWNMSADPRQRAVIVAAQTAIASEGKTPIFELFSNSPMWWMLSNHNPSGNGNNDNLLSAYFKQHAVYMATVAAYAPAHWGFSFNTVEAFNEPSGSWGASGTQEGCHVSHGAQASVLTLLRPAMDAVGLQNTPIASSDECTVVQAIGTWNSFNASVRALFPQWNLHGYEGASSNRAEMYQLAAVQGGKVIRNSEYGDGDDSGLTQAINTHLDFAWLHPRSFVIWQAIDASQGWGPLYGDVASARISGVTAKWFVIAQYSRHITPGMTIMSISTPSTVNTTIAAYDAATSTLVVVVLNPSSNTAAVTVDLGAFSTVSGPATRWATDASSNGADRHTQYNDVTLSGKTFVANMKRASLQTFEIQGVVA